MHSKSVIAATPTETALPIVPDNQMTSGELFLVQVGGVTRVAQMFAGKHDPDQRNAWDYSVEGKQERRWLDPTAGRYLSDQVIAEPVTQWAALPDLSASPASILPKQLFNVNENGERVPDPYVTLQLAVRLAQRTGIPWKAIAQEGRVFLHQVVHSVLAGNATEASTSFAGDILRDAMDMVEDQDFIDRASHG